MNKLHKIFTLCKSLPRAKVPYSSPATKLFSSPPHLFSVQHSLTTKPRSFFTSDSESDGSSNGNGGNKYGQRGMNIMSAPHMRNQPNNSGVFVSKFFEVSNDEIFKFLDTLKLEYKVRPTGQISVKYCPFCEKPHYNKPDNLWSLNLKPDSGAYLCFRCGVKGSWFDFKNRIVGGGKNLATEIESTSMPAFDSSVKRINRTPAPEPKIASESVAYLRLRSLLLDEFPDINQYLTGTGPEERHLSIETLEKYKVGVGYESYLDANGEFVELPSVYFPMYACKKDKSIKIVKPKSKEKEEQEVPPQVELKDGLMEAANLEIMQQIEKENLPKPEKQAIDVEEQEKPHKKTIIEINDNNNILVRTKVRAIYKKNKGYQKMEPAPGYWGLFGLNTVSPRDKHVVITEGEYDAMAVYEATKMPAISLPNGANHLPLQVLPWLERFERIYLWMDADAVGQTNAVNFAHKLGVGRVFIVNTKKFDPEGPKDANDALRKDPSSLIKYIQESRPLTRDSITTFSEMKSQILNRILRYEENTGIKSHYFRWFNSKIKGFRKGEMTILTGGTGSGKTTVLSQLSLDFAKQGIGTLWGSFEVKNEILMTNMLQQYAGISLYKEPHKFEYHAQNFEKIPLYFLKFFGSNDVDKVLHTIEFAIYAYDIGHIIIDNLQFLLSGQGRGFERFDIQDDAIAKLREMATTKNVHVTLVVHPKKVDDNQDLTISSVFGSAKATQEADNIIIIQNRPKYKVIEIKKNRYDGDLGKIPLGFDKESKRFFELKESEVLSLHRTPETIKEVVEKRRSTENDAQLSEAIHDLERGIEEAHKEVLKERETLFEETGDINAQVADASKVTELPEEVNGLPEHVLKELIKEATSEKGVEIVKFEENTFENSQLDQEGVQDNQKTVLSETKEEGDGTRKTSYDYAVESERTLQDPLPSFPEEKPEEPVVQMKEEGVKEEKTEEIAQEKAQSSETEKKSQDVKESPKKKEVKKQKGEGLYGKMYDVQNKTILPRDSFMSDEDKEAVRENMEYLDKERQKKFGFNKKKKTRMQEIEEDILAANGQGNKKD